MIIDIVCTFSATTIEAEAKSVSLVLTFPVTQAPSNICDEVKACLGISPTGSNTKYLNEKGLWTTPAGGGGGSYIFENGLTEDTGTVKLGGELTEKTEIKTGADNWIAFGEIMDEQWGFVMGDLTDFDNSEQSFLGVFNFFNVHGFGEGLFMTAVGTQDAPQVVWVGTQQPGGENISGMAVYDEDANIQQAFLRLSFNVNTKEGYAKLSCPSQYTPIDNLHQNQFIVDKEATRLLYHKSTSGEIISQKLTDDGILIEKYDSDDDPTSKVPLNQIDYNGFIYLGAESLDGSWRFATSSGNLVIEKRVAGVWVTKQTLV
jgi:hypothetical protein